MWWDNPYIYSGLLVFTYMCCWYCIALLKKDNGIVDIAWGIGFILIAFSTLFRFGDMMPRQLLISIVILIWGLRLAAYIFMRNKLKKGEDFRYANWRKQWGKTFYWRSFLQVFMLQGTIMVAVALPIIHVNTYNQFIPINYIDIFALLLFVIGFYFEAVGDWQMYLFKKNPSNKGKIMMEGLWKYTRHPNYFGEVVMWWAIFIISIQSHQIHLSVISPILLTFLLLRVSGVPMLEAKYKNNRTYQRYVKNTSSFIPRAPKG